MTNGGFQRKVDLCTYGGRSGQTAGLRLAYSYDGRKWTALNGEKPFLVPEVGKGLMIIVK